MTSDAPRTLLDEAGGTSPLGEGESQPPPTYAALNRFLEERARLVAETRYLHARFGPQGTFAEQREILRSQLALEYRERMLGGESRITQAMIDEAVRADERYLSYVQEAEESRARLYVMSDRIRQINARIAFIFGPRVASLDQGPLAGPADVAGHLGEGVV